MSRIRSRDQRNLTFHDGAFWLDIRINKRRYREKAGATETKARAYRDDLKAWGRAAKKGHAAAKPEGAPATFETLSADYLRLYARSKKSYARDVRCMDDLGRFFKGRRLKDINLKTILEYRAFRADVKASTRNREIACLKTALRMAVDWHLLPSYPLPAKGVREKVKKFEPYPLTHDEGRRLIAASKPEWVRRAIIVYLYTGMRKSEVLKLKREHVNFATEMLTVVAENSKSGKPRTIPLDPLAVEALRLADGKVYFLENPSTGQPYKDLFARFKRALVAAGIPTRCRVHDLRHAYGSWQIAAGTDVKTLSELMGHASATITLDLYVHSNLEQKRKAANRLPDLVEGGRKLQTGVGGEAATASDSVN